MKTPEEYFLEADLLPEGGDTELTEAERTFLDKYMGGGDEEAGPPPEPAATMPEPATEKAPRPAEEPPMPETETETAPEVPAPEVPAGREAAVEEDPALEQRPEAGRAGAEEEREESLRTEPVVQLVSFFVDDREFTVPISAVQEVIRFMQPTKLPAAPEFLAGVINLRGRVTPLVRLHHLLGLAGSDEDNRFIVVCRRKGLQFGLMIQRMKTMHRVEQENIDWSVEAHLGVAAEFVAGLLKQDGGLVGVLSVERIVDTILSGQGAQEYA